MEVVVEAGVSTAVVALLGAETGSSGSVFCHPKSTWAVGCQSALKSSFAWEGESFGFCLPWYWVTASLYFSLITLDRSPTLVFKESVFKLPICFLIPFNIF